MGLNGMANACSRYTVIDQIKKKTIAMKFKICITIYFSRLTLLILSALQQLSCIIAEWLREIRTLQEELTPRYIFSTLFQFHYRHTTTDATHPPHPAPDLSLLSLHTPPPPPQLPYSQSHLPTNKPSSTLQLPDLTGSSPHIHYQSQPIRITRSDFFLSPLETYIYALPTSPD